MSYIQFDDPDVAEGFYRCIEYYEQSNQVYDATQVAKAMGGRVIEDLTTPPATVPEVPMEEEVPVVPAPQAPQEDFWMSLPERVSEPIPSDLGRDVTKIWTYIRTKKNGLNILDQIYGMCNGDWNEPARISRQEWLDYNELRNRFMCVRHFL